MSAFGLHAGSSNAEFVAVLDRVHAEMSAQTAKILSLEAMLSDAKKKTVDPKDLTELKSFQTLEKWNGSEKTFGDWEFQFQQFVRPYKEFERWLDWLKDQEEEITAHDAADKQREVAAHNPDVNLEWYDEQLYAVLSLLTTGSALQTVKNKREQHGTRGSNSWHKLTREVAGKSGVRLERLADLVHHPKAITTYKDALSQLEVWDNNRQELEKLEGQALSDLTKRTTLKAMIPPDLVRDLERDRGLKTWEEAWKFVLEQAPLRKDWVKTKKGRDDMDVDMAEKSSEEPVWECPECEAAEQDALTLKGGGKGGAGKGTFEGYCGHCWIWGHKRSECRKLTAELAAKGKGKKGEEPKGKGKTGPPWQPAKGGWQQKGGSGKNNWSKGGSGKNNWSKGGAAFNIDGDMGSNHWGYEQQDWSSMAPGRFFMLESDDGGEDEFETCDSESVVGKGPIPSESASG